jgi:outer membrane protein OmpA-like peptidoglycan-associated protein
MQSLMRLLLTLCTLVLLGTAAHAEPDAKGGKDPSVFTRMQGFHINRYDELAFGKHDFPTAPGKAEAVEGRVFKVIYYANNGTKQPSGLQIVRNYANAAKSLGGKVVYESEDGGTQYSTLFIAQKDADVWAEVSGADNGMYQVTVVEKQRMAQEVRATALVLGNDIKTTGHAAVYGIYFDTGKATIKPESDATLTEIAKMLKAEPALKLNVVGHTDNVGGMDSNMKLSMARGEAVAQALVARHGIAADRLKGYGVSSLAPVASNDTDAGRAKNRRVELVKQ